MCIRRQSVLLRVTSDRLLAIPDITLDKMPWPSALGATFRADVEAYAATMEALAMRMLPIYARALDLPHDYFTPAFESPLWRLRFNRYPAKPDSYEDKEFGISPHVDTSFFTILDQGAPGLCVHDQANGQWVKAPVIDGGLLVNTGELLRSITNDTWLATRHYVSTQHTSITIDIRLNMETQTQPGIACALWVDSDGWLVANAGSAHRGGRCSARRGRAATVHSVFLQRDLRLQAGRGPEQGQREVPGQVPTD